MPDANPLGEAIAKAARVDLEQRGRGKIVVPEWKVDGEPVTIWFRPLTVEQQFEIANYRRDEGIQYGLARTIILKAEDVDGKRLFTYEQEWVFLKASAADVVNRIATAIAAGPSIEEAEKN